MFSSENGSVESLERSVKLVSTVSRLLERGTTYCFAAACAGTGSFRLKFSSLLCGALCGLSSVSPKFSDDSLQLIA